MGSRFPYYYHAPHLPWGTPPGKIDNEFKVLVTSSWPNSVYETGAVILSKVSGIYNSLYIHWKPDVLAISYNIYFGYSLFISQAKIIGNTTDSFFSYQYPISVPYDVYPQVWIESVRSNGSILIQSQPATFDNAIPYTERKDSPLEINYASNVIDNDYMRFVYSEARRHEITMIQNDGEDFIIHCKRYTGTVCPCSKRDNLVSGGDDVQGYVEDETKGIGLEPNNDIDPRYEGAARCKICFGTGIVGGYYFGLLNKMRYSDMVIKKITYKRHGLELELDYNTRALWEPKLHDHDIALRIKTGEIYEMSGTGRGEHRGIPFHQMTKLNLLPPGDIRYLITDAAIQTADEKYG